MKRSLINTQKLYRTFASREFLQKLRSSHFQVTLQTLPSYDLEEILSPLFFQFLSLIPQHHQCIFEYLRIRSSVLRLVTSESDVYLFVQENTRYDCTLDMAAYFIKRRSSENKPFFTPYELFTYLLL